MSRGVDRLMLQAVNQANANMQHIQAMLLAEKAERDRAIELSRQRAEDERLERERLESIEAAKKEKQRRLVRNIVIAAAAFVVLLVLVPEALVINAHRNAIERIQNANAARAVDNANARLNACHDSADGVTSDNNTNASLVAILEASKEATPTQTGKDFVDGLITKVPPTRRVRNCTPEGIADFYAIPQGPNAYLPSGG